MIVALSWWNVAAQAEPPIAPTPGVFRVAQDSRRVMLRLEQMPPSRLTCELAALVQGDVSQQSIVWDPALRTPLTQIVTLPAAEEWTVRCWSAPAIRRVSLDGPPGFTYEGDLDLAWTMTTLTVVSDTSAFVAFDVPRVDLVDHGDFVAMDLQAAGSVLRPTLRGVGRSVAPMPVILQDRPLLTLTSVPFASASTAAEGLLAFEDGNPSSGRSALDATAPALVTDTLDALADIAVERARSQAQAAISEALTHLVCDDLALEHDIQLVVSGRVALTLSKGPLLPRTCDAVRGVALGELVNRADDVSWALQRDGVHFVFDVLLDALDHWLDGPSTFVVHRADDLWVYRGGDQATFGVALAEPPAGTLTVRVEASSEQGTVQPDELTFTPENWTVPQDVTVTGGTAGLWEAVLTPRDGRPTRILVRTIDPDAKRPEILVRGGPVEVTEGSNQPHPLEVALATEPEGTVRVRVGSDDETEATVEQTQLEFTKKTWRNIQTVAVKGVDDHQDDRSQGFRVWFDPMSPPSDYQGVPGVHVDGTTRGDRGVCSNELAGHVARKHVLPILREAEPLLTQQVLSGEAPSRRQGRALLAVLANHPFVDLSAEAHPHCTESEVDEILGAECAAQIAVSVAGSCVYSGGCDSGRIAEMVRQPDQFFHLGGTCSSLASTAAVRDGVEQLAARLIDAALPAADRSDAERASAVVAVAFDLVDLLVRRLPDSDERDTLAAILPRARGMMEATIAGDRTMFLLEFLSVLRYVIENDARGKDEPKVDHLGRVSLNPQNKAWLALQRASPWLGVFARYADNLAVEIMSDDDAERRREARQQALEELVDQTTRRVDRDGQVVAGIGAGVGLDVAFDLTETSVAPRPYLPMGVALQVLPDRNWLDGQKRHAWGIGWHAQASLVDLGAFADPLEPADAAATTPRYTWNQFVIAGGQLGVIVGTPSLPFVLAVDGRYEPAREAFLIGPSLSFYVPFFDFN